MVTDADMVEWLNQKNMEWMLSTSDGTESVLAAEDNATQEKEMVTYHTECILHTPITKNVQELVVLNQ